MFSGHGLKKEIGFVVFGRCYVMQELCGRLRLACESGEEEQQERLDRAMVPFIYTLIFLINC